MIVFAKIDRYNDLNGLYIKLKHLTVSGEAIYFTMDVDEVDPWLLRGGQESFNGWREILKVRLMGFPGLNMPSVNPMPRATYSIV